MSAALNSNQQISSHALVSNDTKSMKVSEDTFSVICLSTVILMVIAVYVLAKYTK